VSELKAAKNLSLKRRLGEAILARGVSVHELMKEWDRNGDGDINRTEFKKAVRQSLKMKMTDAELATLYDESFDPEGKRRARCSCQT